MHLATSLRLLRVFDNLMYGAPQRWIAAGGVGVELTPYLDGEPLIHFAQRRHQDTKRAEIPLTTS
jgi:hypothetical protein